MRVGWNRHSQVGLCKQLLGQVWIFIADRLVNLELAWFWWLPDMAVGGRSGAALGEAEAFAVDDLDAFEAGFEGA
jgi:hypothetical protein